MLHNFMEDSFTISFLMKMITDRVDTMITRGLTVECVTASQGRVLAYLMSRDGEMVSQKDIARHLGVSHTTIKGIVQRLEQKGWVTTAFNSEDGRLKNVYLTEACRKVHKIIRQQIDVIESTLLKGVSEEECSRMKVLLMQMYNNVK